MTKAEQDLLDYIVGWSRDDDDPREVLAGLWELRRLVASERLLPGTREKWVALYAAKLRDEEKWKGEFAALKVPVGLEIGDWFAEAREKVENEK